MDQAQPGLREHARLHEHHPVPDIAVIAFAHPADAERLVAGLPAVARMIRAARLAGIGRCIVDVGRPWEAPSAVDAEMARMAGTVQVSIGDARQAIPPGSDVLVIAGHRQPDAGAIAAAARGEIRAHPGVRLIPAGNLPAALARIVGDAAQADALLESANRAALRATGKEADGIVSRLLNRPVSRAISGQLLRLSWIRPAHATVGTALLALAMFATLLSPGENSLVAGALLFHAASVFDGVDGEIARATYRSSASGARADSLVDAATNLAFVLGVAINLDTHGRDATAALGYAALAIFALGLGLIGHAASRGSRPFGFDLVKEKLRNGATGPGRARLVRVATFLTSRDFIALFFALMIAIGYAERALALFALAATCWLAAVIWALTRRVA